MAAVSKDFNTTATTITTAYTVYTRVEASFKPNKMPLKLIK